MSTPVYMNMGKNKDAEEQTIRREGTGKTEGGLPLFFKNLKSKCEFMGDLYFLNKM